LPTDRGTNMQTPYHASYGQASWRARLGQYAARSAAHIRRRSALLLLAFNAGLAGPAAAETISSVQQGLVAVESTKFWTDNGKRIPMCWDKVYGFANPEAAAAAQSFVVRTIEEGWANPLGLHITWATCPTSGEQLHVRTLLRSGDANFNGTTLKPGM